MKKQKLLEILNNSILKDDAVLGGLYEKYYPPVCAVLKPFNGKTKIGKLSALDGVSSPAEFDAFLRTEGFDGIEKRLKLLLKELRDWARKQNTDRRKVPDGAEQKRMRLEIIERIDGIRGAYADGVSEMLTKARNALDGTFLPKDDAGISDCFETVCEELDGMENGPADKPEVSAQKIYDAVNRWLNLKR